MNNAPARNRATEAFRASRVLLVIEAGEEADGKEERTTMPELLGVLSAECRHLLLTRLSTQSAAAESIELREALQPDEAARLFDALTASRPLDPAIRQSVLDLLEGHPLALNWASNLLVRDDEEPAELIRGWKTEGLPLLSDPRQAERTLRWLYERSIRGLDETGQLMLAAAGLLAPTPFSLDAMAAATGLAESGDAGRNRLREHLRNLVQRGLFRLAESGRWRFTHVLAYRFARDAQNPEAALGDRLAHWLRDALAEALNPSENNSKLSDATALLNHAGALLRADRQHTHWEVLANPLLYAIADRLEELGRLDLVSGALSSVADWLETLPSENRTDPIWLREYTVLVNRKGDVLRDQGDLDGALNAFRESLAVRKRLAAADPSHAGWQRDLSVSLTKLAEIHEKQSEPALALPLAEQSLSIDERLSALDKSNVMWQKDVEVSRRLVNRLREAIR
jgi:tetratricopeptide (TPR) repeat protein